MEATDPHGAGSRFWQPMAHPADSRRNPPTVIVSAEGVHLTDSEGNRLLDAVGGLWNVNLGYSCAAVKEAIRAQLERLPYYNAFRGATNDRAVELSGELARFFDEEGMERAFFTLGGSDSVEVALKMARQYHRLRGEGRRTKFLSFKRGYHGTHFGGASVNGNAKFRAAYEPLLPGCFHLPAPHAYRNPHNESDPERLAALCVAALEDEIAFQGADTIAALIAEPVMGAGGVIVPHASLMPRLREVCSRSGILLISDEVVTGFGRVGEHSGARLWGVRPDMMTVAKAITSGYFPFGAVLVAGHVAEPFESDTSGEGALDTGYTYSGHPVGAAAALAALAETRRLRLHENARVLGERLLGGLKGLVDRHENAGDARGKGLMCAIELVRDKAGKVPVAAEDAERMRLAVRDAGVMIRMSGNVVILSPPLVAEAGDIDRIVCALDAGLGAIGR